jgi:hypothetical protein
MFAAATAVACGGRSDLDVAGTSAAVSDLDGGSWGLPDAAGEPWSPACPETAPGTGSACSVAGVYCEYGAAWWDVSCDTILQCNDGSWETAEVSQETCFPAPPANSPSCPSSPVTIPLGAPCPHPGLACYYGQGAICSCSVPEGLDALDGGAAWGCGPDPGCPSARPRLGTTCQGDQICEYDDASGFAEICQGGIWGPGLVSN